MSATLPPKTPRPAARRRLGVATAALLALTIGPFAAQASLMPSLGMERLLENSDLVVHGDVIAVATRRGGTGRVYTDAVVEVREVLRGALPEVAASAPARVIVRVPGGELEDGTAVQVSGAPRVAVGDERVWFLRQAGAVYGLVGLEQGVWRLEPASASAPDADRVLRPGHGGASADRHGASEEGVAAHTPGAAEGPWTLERLRARVRAPEPTPAPTPRSRPERRPLGASPDARLVPATRGDSP